jgi:hypothetical protein
MIILAKDIVFIIVERDIKQCDQRNVREIMYAIWHWLHALSAVNPCHCQCHCQSVSFCLECSSVISVLGVLAPTSTAVSIVENTQLYWFTWNKVFCTSDVLRRSPRRRRTPDILRELSPHHRFVQWKPFWRMSCVYNLDWVLSRNNVNFINLINVCLK